MFTFVDKKVTLNFSGRYLISVLVAAIVLMQNLALASGPKLSDKEINTPPPRIIRTCCAFGANIGFAGIPFAKKTDITSPSTTGNHVFLGGKEEKNGNIYTRRGGFLDMGHLRDCADWTAYLYEVIQAGKNNSSYKIIDLGNEGGQKWLTLHFPENLSIDESIQLAGKIAYDISVWHEISTWFGASYVPMIPERYSSFSPEDLYSNLMGVHLAMEALASELPYNEAMTLAISNKLKELEAVETEAETLDAMLQVDKVWYDSEKRFPSRKVLVKRYLDPGSDLIPWLIPENQGIFKPYILNKPEEYLTEYYELNLKLNYKFPVKELYPDNKNRFITQNDFKYLIDYIQENIAELEARDMHSNESNKRVRLRDNSDADN